MIKRETDRICYGEGKNDKNENPIVISLDEKGENDNEVTEMKIGGERELRTEMDDDKRISEEENSDYEDARIEFFNNEDTREEEKKWKSGSNYGARRIEVEQVEK